MTGARPLARAAAVALPPSLVAAWAITGADVAHGWVALAAAFVVSVALSWSIDGALRRRLLTVSSVLAAYREGDFSIRARGANADGLLRDVLAELNLLGDVLRGHRLGEMEAWALLRKVMAEVDVVVVAVDDDHRIRLANDAASRVFGKASRELIGERAEGLDLGPLLEGTVPRIVSLAGGAGPWELRRGTFRLSGEAQTLIVLSDVSRALRDNERDAWRRLIRVIGHEINNSLSPIGSIAQSLLAVADSKTRPPDWEGDLRDGLEVIGRRAEALSRFMSAYAALARLPPPRLGPVDVGALVAKIASLETRVPVVVEEGPTATLAADADQLEQALINLVRNGAEAALTTNGGVRIGWSLDHGVAIAVADDGPGVSDTANLFVPFFTTKAGGSGIGLVLSRQIVEAHGGRLSLVSGPDGRGALARMWLPLRDT